MLAALLIACGGDDSEPRTTPATGAVSSAGGPGISILEAINSDLEGPLLVNGFLVAKDDSVRFCSALAESFPPQCAGESLEVEGIDLSRLEGLQQAQDVRWSDQIQLLGEIEGETLKVSQNVIS